MVQKKPVREVVHTQKNKTVLRSERRINDTPLTNHGPHLFSPEHMQKEKELPY